MPRRSKGPRLYLDSRPDRKAYWIIRDGTKRIATSCDDGDVAGAENALAEYLSQTRLNTIRRGHPDTVAIADCLSLYAAERAPLLKSPEIVLFLTPPLLEHAGNANCGAINGAWCRRYVEKRTTGKIGGRPVKEATARRELEHLSACIGFARKEGLLTSDPSPITLPSPAKARTRWLTRDEVAKLIWTAWRNPNMKHIARFILVGFYTGTRSGAILTARFTAASGWSYIDIETGMFYRLAIGTRESNKRQPPIAIPSRLWAHLRRWQKQREFVVDWRGRPVGAIKRGFAQLVKDSGLGDDVKPHTLRHTFVTQALRAGMTIGSVAEQAGMDEEMVRKVYGHFYANRRAEIDAVFSYRETAAKLPQAKGTNNGKR